MSPRAIKSVICKFEIGAICVSGTVAPLITAARAIRAGRLGALAVARYSSSTSRCLRCNQGVTDGQRSLTNSGLPIPFEHGLNHFAESHRRTGQDRRDRLVDRKLWDMILDRK